MLHDADIVAKPGDRIALVGATGAGKTTIINLLLRFYDATNGSVRIDGHDVRWGQPGVAAAADRAGVAGAVSVQREHSRQHRPTDGADATREPR